MYIISFEGGEYAGKGTQIISLRIKLQQIGFKVNSQHFEPGSTPKAELLRIIVKNKYDTEFKFPDDVIKQLELEKNASFFKQDKISEVAEKYLEDIIKNSKTTIKNELVHFILHDELPKNSELTRTMQKIKEKNPENPAHTLFKEYLTKEKLTPRMQENAFYAARNILYHNYINEPNKDTDIMIIDRSLDSTAVYQGHVFNPRRVENIRQENLNATEGTVPNITFFLDIPIDELFKRRALAERGDYNDFFDGQKKEFHEKVREGYIKEMKYYENLPKNHKEHGRIKLINAQIYEDMQKNMRVVHEKIYGEVMREIEKTKN
jgi:dTMP kinase